MVAHTFLNQISGTKPKRETAHVWGFVAGLFAAPASSVTVETVARLSSNCSATVSLHRYPSPDRPAYSPSRPITGFRPSPVKSGADIGYQRDLLIDPAMGRDQSRAAEHKTVGLGQCKRHHSFLPQLQYLVWQVALITMQSAGSQVRRAVWSQLKCWALTLQPRLSLAPLQASSVTTPAFAANTTPRVLTGARINSENRRWGQSLTAVF